jgi:hypothetical protein
VHSSVHKAVELLGLGRDALHLIPVDPEYRIEFPALEAAIAADRQAGHQPLCVVGNAGTVNTGAIDDLIAWQTCVNGKNVVPRGWCFGALAALRMSCARISRGWSGPIPGIRSA